MSRVEREERASGFLMNRGHSSAQGVEQTEFEPKDFEGLARWVAVEKILSGPGQSLSEKAGILGCSVDERETRFDGIPGSAIEEITERIP